MHKRRSGFSLVELLIVMGIIILLVTMAIPSVRVLTGTRSISVAQNQLAAVLTRAREEAIALQDIRGVLFYIDPTTGRVAAAIVQQAVITDTSNIIFNTVLLDTLPGNDSLLFPPAVGVQTIINGMDATGTNYYTMTNAVHSWHVNAATRAQMSATQQHDRYLGFWPAPGQNYHGSTIPFMIGGCILFDGSGRLIVRPYAFQLATYTGSAKIGPSNLCRLMGFDVDASGNPTFVGGTFNGAGVTYLNPPSKTGSVVIIPGGLTYPNYTNMFPKVPLVSQLGLILFDHDAFQSLGFTDADADVQGIGYSTPWPVNGTGGVNGDGIHSEADEENWLDVNSTPITVNRVNGTLIRGE